MQVKAILGFDIDGTLTRRNTEIILPEKLPLLLNELDNLGYLFVPVTGKPSTYALRIINVNGLEQSGIIAENAGVYIKPKENKPKIYGPNLESIYKLKQLVGLKPKQKGFCKIAFNDKSTDIIVDPEDISIFTLFTNPDAVKHKWQYETGMTTSEIFSALDETIRDNSLSDTLQLLPAFPDGGIQVIRRNDAKVPIDKSSLPEVTKIMYESDNLLPIAMFGDGHNDIPAMSPESIIPITFSNSEEAVKDFVINKGGFVSKFDSIDDIGATDGLYWLLKAKNFFKSDSEKVSKLFTKYFPKLTI